MTGQRSPDTGWEARLRASFERQKIMRLIGATLGPLTPGRVVIELPYRDDLTQQHGFIHAGVVATVVDSACGYAALSRADAGTAVLTVEFKVNLMEPAQGDELIATGRVLRAGRRVTVCEGTAEAVAGSDRIQVAHMLGTVMTLPARGALRD